MRLRLPIPALFLWLLTLAAGRCAAYEFTVEGEVRFRGYNKGQLEGEKNYNFTAEIRDCSSRIRVSGGAYSLPAFMEYGWDATNSYMFVKLRAGRETKVIHRVEGGQVKSVTLEKPVKSMNDATLSIHSRALPVYGAGMEPIWLAYASPCYYRLRKSGDKIEPVWRMGGGVREARLLFKSEWRFNPEFPQFLAVMADFTDGNKHDPLSSESLAVRMPKPFDVEATNSVYQVLSWTNVAGMILPDRFQVVLHVASDEGASPSLHVHTVYEGFARSIRPGCATTDFSPNVSGGIPTQITDHRLENDNIPARAIGYFSPDGKVRNIEEIRLREGYVPR